MKKGFTLIELLVVVLIIGILAAIALPMYTRAVAKSRLAEPVTNLGTLQGAVDRYIMERGVVAPTSGTVMENLDIAMPTGDGERWDYDVTVGVDEQVNAMVTATPHENQILYVRLIARRGPSGNWTKTCQTYGDDEALACYLCGSLEGNGFENLAACDGNGGGNSTSGTGGN